MLIQTWNLKANEIQGLKTYFIQELKNNFEGIAFNGYSEDIKKSSYIILNVRFPKEYAMLLFNLDLKGISASGGSACQSGSNRFTCVKNILSEKMLKILPFDFHLVNITRNKKLMLL